MNEMLRCLVLVCVLEITTVVPSLAATPVHVPRKVALLVGISDYQRGARQGRDTDGFGYLSTEPDLVNMERVLTAYGFVCHVLSNEQATQANILAAFRERLTKDAGPKDSLVFYFTGHGHVVTAESDPNEPDGLDEVLVTWTPPDVQMQTREKRRKVMYLVDDTLGSYLQELSDKMRGASGKVEGSVTVILDSCHSGDGIKSALQIKGRPWDNALDGPLPQKALEQGGAAQKRGSGWIDRDPPEGVVFLSACESDRSSFMMENRAQGSVMTHFLTEELERLRPVRAGDPTSASYRTLYEHIRDSTQARQIWQVPQIAPMLDSPVFGDWRARAARSPDRTYLRVVPSREKQAAGTITLNGGSVIAVTPHSRYALFPAGTAPPAQGAGTNASGTRVEILSVSPFEAIARFVEPLPPTRKAIDFLSARAIETTHQFSGTPLRILLADDSGAPETWRAQARRDAASVLAGLPYVVAVEQGEFEVRLLFDRDGHCRYTNRSGLAPVDLGSVLDAAAFRQLLQRDWRWRQFELLETPGSPFAGKLAADICDISARTFLYDRFTGIYRNMDTPEGMKYWKHPVESRDIRLHTGDSAQILFRNATGTPLFVYVVYLTSDGDVRVVTPNYEQGKDARQYPADNAWRAVSDIRNVRAAAGREHEVFKVIAIPRKHDLSGINEPKQNRDRNKSTGNDYLDLLLNIKDGDVAASKQVDAIADWEILTLRIEID